MEPIFLSHPTADVSPGGAVVVTPWTGETPAAKRGQGVRLQVNHKYLARSSAALVVEPPANGWLTMGKTAHGSPAGEVLTIYQGERPADQAQRLMIFIPMEVSMSPTPTPMRHSLLYTRPRFLRRTPANVFVLTAAYIPDTDGSHWKGFREGRRGGGCVCGGCLCESGVWGVWWWNSTGR